ncbi:hypothetical protein CTZ28_39840 [Streptomyces shenzhenensis]|uniref:Uncharacterized protein n=1 Tax=Streptomyces shenzhenensis TaxID=943815 RepID=A0A3M0HSU7_9ACTN|nr:hypothetical protein CTZ28_39840 [Streptomyces shenzhenensis]
MIAVAASAWFIVAMRMLFVGVKVPDDVRDALAEQRRRDQWKAYFLVPVLMAILLGVNLLRPDPASEILFLYSLTFAVIPVAFFPVRGRIFKDDAARQQNPGVEIKPDRFAMVWVICALCLVTLIAVVALSLRHPG